MTVETANHHWLYLTTLVPMLLPSILRAALYGESTALILATSAAILLVYLLVGARKLNRLIVESLNSRFENLELVAQLQRQMAIAEASRLEAEGANRAKSRFLAAASHDLRQPVHALGLFVAALRPHVAGESGARILGRVESTVGSTAALFDAMLDVSRLDAGVLVPEVRSFALAPLLHRLADEYAQHGAAKQRRLRLRVGRHAVASDPTLLERVIRNYLDNAIRHAGQGAVLLASRRRGDTIRIEVWDTGIGIPLDQLDAIYEEFLQLGNAARDRTRGLGLGLAIVRRIARLLGQPIDVASRLGRGSRFSVTVPAIDLPVVTGATDGTPRPPDESLLVGASILLIDDDLDAREAVEVLLRQWGCLVLAADSASNALALVRRHDGTIDAIVSDLRLRDGETGIAAIGSVQREIGATPAMLVSGDTTPDRLREAAASGFVLLHKPLDAPGLKAAICGLLASRAPLSG